MSDADELDGALQARLSALADAASPRLDELARRRVLSVVRQEAAHAEREGRLASLADDASPRLDAAGRERVLAAVRAAGAPGATRRWRTPAALFGLAAAAAVAIALASPWQDTSVNDAPELTARACDGWRPPTEGIGRRGALEVDGELRVDAPDGCTTELVLAHGEVGVHARDLGGGVLRVHAGLATVEVRGTRFSVSRSATRVAVNVTEGHVVVTLGDEPEVHLRAGDSWERRATETASAEPMPEPIEPTLPLAEPIAVVEPASAPRRRARPDAPRAPVADPPTAAEELSRAEALWRQGERVEARAVFRGVGLGRGPIAEAAWVRLARNELRTGDASAARAAARMHGRRFPTGRLGAEALWLVVQASQRLGEPAAADRARSALRQRYPGSPQARAAESAE